MSEVEEFIARPYQIDLCEQAMAGNTIIYLPTGSGKTYITVLVIKKMSASVRNPWGEGAKRTIFLVNTIPLVAQQCEYIARHTDLSCNGYTGDMNVDSWTYDAWTQEFINYQVLVMTSQILLDLLNHGYLSLSRINLLIFDECHHAVGDHPMRSIMRRFGDFNSNLWPKVLGTSATLLNSNVKIENVEKTVYDLEITFHAKVITVDSMASVKGFGKPKEAIQYYEPFVGTNISTKLENYIDHVINILNMGILLLEKVSESSPNFRPRSKSVKIKCIFESLKEYYNLYGLYFMNKAILYNMVQLEKIKKCFQELQSIIVIDFSITELVIMRKIISDEMKGSTELENMLMYSSDQVKKLFEVIYKFYTDSINDNNKFCCIIFVQRRFTAKILYHVLKCRAEDDPRFKFLIPQYVVGMSGYDPLKSPYEDICLQKWSEEALAKFRLGIVNCLVATDVLDEGVDIPVCSLVIRFDAPLDFRAYVQSKGRARHVNSNFILLLSKDSTFVDRYNSYRRVEKVLMEKLINNSKVRLEPLPDDIKENLYKTEIEPLHVVNTAGITAAITGTSAISLVNRYCCSLSRSKFAIFTPIWILYKSTEGTDECFMVNLTLPITSPIKETIQGNIMPSILLAKRSAAMKACKKLYDIGELNDNLLPKDFSEIFEDTSLHLPNWQEESEEDAKTVGTTSKKRPYNIVHPKALYGAFPMPNQECYLHAISTKPTYPIPDENRKSVFYNMIDDRAGFAILTSNQIQKIPDFPIFISAGKLETKLNVNIKKVYLTSDEIMKLRQFHWVIFKEILDLVKSFMIYDDANKENSFLVVPIDKDWNINWDIVHRYPSVRYESSQCHSIRAITNDTENSPVVDECDWQLVIPNYRGSTNIYVVTRICDELTPKSAFPTDDYRTYIHYFQERHGLVIIDQNRPLLEVNPITKKINCIKPRGTSRSSGKRNRNDLEEHLIPELCRRIIFPALYWLKASLLPSILHRVMQLLIADDLRREIAVATGLGVIDPDNKWPPLVLQQNGNDESADAFSQMEMILDENNLLDSGKSDLTPTSPDIDLLLSDPARYSWSKDQEPCDLERNFEKVQLIDIDYFHQFTKVHSLLNDKYIMKKYQHNNYKQTKSNVSVKVLTVLNKLTLSPGPSPTDIMLALTPKFANDAFDLERLETLGDSYLKFIVSLYLFENHPTFNEGRLTSIKGKIIGNRHLYYCGVKKKIPGRLKVDDFEPLSNFIVPSYCTPRQIQKAVKSKNKSPNVLYQLVVPIDEQFQGKLSAETENNFHSQIEMWIDAKNTTGVEQFVGFQIVPDKTISDSVESLIGVYLNSMGLNGAAVLLKWFGVLPNRTVIHEILYNGPSTARLAPGDISLHIPFADYIENTIGYKFNDRSFLLQAFTHPSYTSNRITGSYDRLEFLGDAVIDFLITVYIYENCGDLTPGTLTDLRSALVNNITFACLTVKYGLHTGLLAYAPLLTETIEKFVKFQEERDHLINDELLWILLEENDCNMVEWVDVPKVLGDLFESIIAAIYLDSGKDLARVWEIIYCLMHEEIESFSKNVPKQPVRVIYETQGANPKFLNAEFVEDTKFIVVPLEVQILGKKKLFHGFGTTKKQAKAAAAKHALKSIIKHDALQ